MIEYFAVVTRFPLLRMAANPNSNPEEIQTKTNGARRTIRVANIIFYTLIIGGLIIGYWADPRHPNIEYFVSGLINSVLKVISGLVLIYSLLKFKRLVKSMGARGDFFTSERLMFIHLFIFLVYIFANLGRFISQIIEWYFKDEVSGSTCRNYITEIFF